MNYYRPSGFLNLPEVVKNIIIINVIMFLLSNVLLSVFNINLWDQLGLHWLGAEKFQIYQFVTYMFMHGSFSHLFFNMFAVWMFGTAIENEWGKKRFLIFYFVTGFGAAIIHYLFSYLIDIFPFINLIDNFIENPSQESFIAFISKYKFSFSPEINYMFNEAYNNTNSAIQALYQGHATSIQVDDVRELMIMYKKVYLNQFNVVGASGSLFGILLAFGMLFPNVPLFLMFIPIPIKAKYFVIGYGIIELIEGISRNLGDNVAHFAHLGGMIFGYILIKYWKRKYYI